MRFTNVTNQWSLTHFLIKITHCKAIIFRLLKVSLSSVRVEGIALTDILDK